MTIVGTTAQNRLLEAARQHLGVGGDAILKDAAQQTLGVPLERVTYAQIPRLLESLEHQSPGHGQRAAATGLAAALDRLSMDVDAGLGARVVHAVGKQLGPAAEPFLTHICERVALPLGEIDRLRLPLLAAAVSQEAAPLLGDRTARTLAQAVLAAGAATPPGLTAQIVRVAVEHVGANAEELLRGLCRDRLEVDLEALSVDGIGALARAVEQEGPARFGAAHAAAFVVAARRALISPATTLRHQLEELATRRMGPAGPDFVRDACAAQGLPFEAVEHEHLMFIAEAMRAEAAPVIGKKGADDLAREVRALLTGRG